MSSAESIRTTLTEAAEILLEAYPEHGYLIVMIDTTDEEAGLSYATNFSPPGLQAVGELFSDAEDDDDLPPGNVVLQ